jgi:hypothetical protein
MGQLIKLTETFTNPALPKLIDYDTSQSEAEILTLPTMRAFWDFSDASTITKDGGNLVSQVNDKSGGGRHWTASANHPLFSTTTMKGLPGLEFDGSANRMQCAGLFSGNPTQTVAAAFYVPDYDGVSRALISDDTDNNQNLYLGSTDFRFNAADVELEVSGASLENMRSKVFFLIASGDAIADTCGLMTNDGQVTGSTGRAPWDGDATLGAFDSGAAFHKGAIGAMIVLDEDVFANATVKTLLADYFTRKFRIV